MLIIEYVIISTQYYNSFVDNNVDVLSLTDNISRIGAVWTSIWQMLSYNIDKLHEKVNTKINTWG